MEEEEVGGKFTEPHYQKRHMSVPNSSTVDARRTEEMYQGSPLGPGQAVTEGQTCYSPFLTP